MPDDPNTAPNRFSALASPPARWIARKAQTIWVQVMGLVLLAVFIPTTTAGWFAVSQFSSLSREKVDQDLRAQALTRREEVERWFAAPVLSIQAVNGSALVRRHAATLARGPGTPGFARSLADLDRSFSSVMGDNPAFRGLAFLDPKGGIIHQKPPGAFAGQRSIPVPPDLGSAPVIVPVREGSRSALLVLQRIEGDAERSNAMVAALLDLSSLRELLGRGGEGTATAYLVDREGRLALGGGVVEGDPPGRGRFEDFVGKGGRSREFIGVRGEEAVGMALPAKGIPWVLVLEIPRAEAWGAVDAFRLRMTWLALGFTVILLIPGLLLAKTIVIPLVEMSRAARHIVGDSKLGLQVETRAWGEMRDLMLAFNTMSRSLYQSMEALRASNEEFRRLSNTDPLTGRHNRRYMQDALARDLKQAKRFSQPLSIIMVDIDHFKVFNDRFGHLTGDEALKGISGVLAVNIRDSDVLARWGGEEFLVSLVQTDKPGAINAAEKLREAVEKLTFQVKKHKSHLTISCGVATFEEDGRTIEELLEAADQALYLAKDEGRNRVASFSGPPPAAPASSGRRRRP
jgi:diguanylate cyclase (GGDEF)-like protein